MLQYQSAIQHIPWLIDFQIHLSIPRSAAMASISWYGGSIFSPPLKMEASFVSRARTAINSAAAKAEKVFTDIKKSDSNAHRGIRYYLFFRDSPVYVHSLWLNLIL